MDGCALRRVESVARDRGRHLRALPSGCRASNITGARRVGTRMSGLVDEQGEVTQLLGAWREGDTGARDRMIALVYGQVRQLAARHLRRQFGQQAVTLQPTELANELFLKLLSVDANWEDRRHFYNAATVALRRILIDAARARGSEKRGGG